MAHKSWKAAQRRKEPAVVVPMDPKPVMDRSMLGSMFQRRTQAEIYEDLKRRHRGDVPAHECWDHLADRREATISTSGAGLIARG